jgi:hypothetical protein
MRRSELSFLAFKDSNTFSQSVISSRSARWLEKDTSKFLVLERESDAVQA